MEDALALEQKENMPNMMGVLILVVMEDALALSESGNTKTIGVEES